jgi:hypothetical protein
MKTNQYIQGGKIIPITLEMIKESLKTKIVRGAARRKRTAELIMLTK